MTTSETPSSASANAIFSDCELHPDWCGQSCPGRKYRYLLRWPTGIEDNRVALGIFANPSTATAKQLDPTLTRWLNYCREWGYGWCWTVNVRAWRATDPKDVPSGTLGIGVDNGNWIKWAVTRADLIVCGWGKLGGSLALDVEAIIREAGKTPHCLRLNKDRSPAHPLYLPANLKPMELQP
jgi:hypothetical protein